MNSQESPINITALLSRQLIDWQEAKRQLEQRFAQTPSPELASQIAYCECKIETLQGEISQL